MINLLESGVVCECGSSQFAPPRPCVETLCICASCARVFRVSVALQPEPWAAVERELAPDSVPFLQMLWTRQGVPPAERRDLALERMQARVPASKRQDRIGTAAAICLLALLSVIARAVFS